MNNQKWQVNLQSDTLLDLSSCSLCPRKCGSDRLAGNYGFCNCDASLCVHSIVLHKGEEPVISGEHGISNVFFSHCNLQCQYCQNYQISDNRRESLKQMELSQVVLAIQAHLAQGAKSIGFVSPSHLIPQMLMIMNAVEAAGDHPVYVMNSNAYDRVEVLRRIAPRINLYLPDFKYMDASLARQLSGAEDYPSIAQSALQEMFRQKGSQLHCDDDGLAKEGLIIRHLVLPGYVENTKACLRYIANELSPDVHVSLMSQYQPTPNMKSDPFNRVLRPQEYDGVMNEMAKLGLEFGWVQALESSACWNPDFGAENPFDSKS